MSASIVNSTRSTRNLTRGKCCDTSQWLNAPFTDNSPASNLSLLIFLQQHLSGLRGDLSGFSVIQRTHESSDNPVPLKAIVHVQHSILPKPTTMYFKITLIRSAIGLPGRTSGVLRALGLRKRFRTVYHPVSPQVAGQIMKVKELVAVSEVDQALTPQQMHEMRRPDPGFFVETPMAQ